jgi:drug/metabolite transporter (DMT)-like permease
MQASSQSVARKGSGVLWPSLAVAASALFWGTTWIPFRKVAEAGVPVSWSALLIYLVPAILVLPLIALRWRKVRAGGWPLLAVGGAVGACNALFAAALTMGEVGMIVLLFYLSPIWAALLERLLFGATIARFRVVAIVLGLAGMVALQGLAGRLPFPANLAEWMGLAAGFFWACGLVAGNGTTGTSALDKTTVQFVCATLVGLVLVLLIGSGEAFPAQDRILAALPWILGAAAIWIGPAMGLSLWGAARMSPTRASMLLMLEVVVAFVSAAWLIGEEVGLNKLIGGALIVSASLVEAWGSARSDRRAAAAAGTGV